MSDEMAEGKFDYLWWFPSGNKAHLFRRAPPEPRVPPTVHEYAEHTWLPRKKPPMVRASLADTYHWALKHIERRFRDVRLDRVTTPALEDFRAFLTGPERESGRGLKMKTARDIIDGSFRALYRDAREIDGLVTGDPFAALRWPAKIDPEPDPFTEEERDLLIDYFWHKNRHYYPLVYTMFFTGLRTGEAVALRWGDVDLQRGRLSVRRSRTMGEDNPPKTKKSKRTITLLDEVVAVLRETKPLHVSNDTFVFTTAIGTSLDGERFVEKHWHRALRATGVRPRKFYATRHKFISVAVGTPGINLKWLADYCGTSIEMIERHYASYMHGDDRQLGLLGAGPPGRGRGHLRAVGGSGSETLTETFSNTPKNVDGTWRRGGDSNSRTP